MTALQAFAEFMHRYTLVAMVAVFVLTVLSLYWPGLSKDRRDQVERLGRIPLEDDR
jgi:cbb3-type cytochrome oxidase subunit 3